MFLLTILGCLLNMLIYLAACHHQRILMFLLTILGCLLNMLIYLEACHHQRILMSLVYWYKLYNLPVNKYLYRLQQCSFNVWSALRAENGPFMS